MIYLEHNDIPFFLDTDLSLLLDWLFLLLLILDSFKTE